MSADVLPTQTTVEGDALASLTVEVDDCYFRMLEPHEIAAAMAFASTYVLTQPTAPSQEGPTTP